MRILAKTERMIQSNFFSSSKSRGWRRYPAVIPRSARPSGIALALHPRLFVIFILTLAFADIRAADLPTAAGALQNGDRIRARWPSERPLDEAKLREDGIRRLDGKHIRLYTDLPPSEAVDELPRVFDLAMPMVCDYFELDPKKAEDFHVEAFLVADDAKFKRGGAVWQVPNLRNGYALRCRIWVREQSSDYYRRHLLIHEGVHALMGWAFGVWGPPWYREGTAEWLGTHHWENGTLKLGYFPRVQKELHGWGRIEHVQGAVEQGKYRTPRGIFELASEDYDANEAYAWSWAFAAFCEGHPRYRRPFRRTAWHLSDETVDLHEAFLRRLCEEQGSSDEENREIVVRFENDWLDYLKNLDYAYDFERTRIEVPTESQPLARGDSATVKVRADRGWQADGLRLERGRHYRLTASGRFQLAREPKIWWAEPSGVTIRYNRGQPLGTLLTTQLPDAGLRIGDTDAAGVSEDVVGVGFFHPRAVGSGCDFTAEIDGPLYFRVNDFASELNDNDGFATVVIEETENPEEETGKERAP